MSGIIGDLDTTIVFATSGTLHAENEDETFADHRENILKTAEGRPWIACASLGVTIAARPYSRQRQTYIETKREATFGCALPIVTHSHLAGTDGTALVSASLLVLIP